MNAMKPNLFLRRTLAYLADIAILFALLGPAGFLIQHAIGYSPSTGPEIWCVLLVNFSIPARPGPLDELIMGHDSGRRLRQHQQQPVGKSGVRGSSRARSCCADRVSDIPAGAAAACTLAQHLCARARGVERYFEIGGLNRAKPR